MRLFVALLLCLTLPLQGWAASGRLQAPCPMGDMVAMHLEMQAHGMGEDVADLGDCCHDAATAALSGKLCKAGLECQTPTGWLGPLSQPFLQAQPTTVRLVTAEHSPPRGAPASVWRPPTL